MLRQAVKRVCSTQGGFTLLEVMIALVVFAIGLLALAAMFVTQTRGNVFSEGMSVANALAIQRLEEVQNTPFSDLETTYPAGTQEYLTRGGQNCTAGTSPPCYVRTMAYTDGPGGTKAVTVTVSWTDAAGAGHSITLTTLKAP